MNSLYENHEYNDGTRINLVLNQSNEQKVHDAERNFMSRDDDMHEKWPKWTHTTEVIGSSGTFCAWWLYMLRFRQWHHNRIKRMSKSYVLNKQYNSVKKWCLNHVQFMCSSLHFCPNWFVYCRKKTRINSFNHNNLILSCGWVLICTSSAAAQWHWVSMVLDCIKFH